MMVILWIILAVCLMGIGYVVWQYFELKKFRVTNYEITTEKVEREIRMAVLADLHGYTYGAKNQRLLEAVKKSRPSLILIPGDFIVSKYPKTYESALPLLKQLTEIAPVYYSFGNHESRVYRRRLTVSGAFAEYKKKAEAAGVIFINNENRIIPTSGGNIAVAGLEIDLDYYEKGRAVPMVYSYVPSLLGQANRHVLQVLLAHNPMYSPQYAAWGADVTLCGHNHGGLICFWGGKSLFSPQLTLFPAYNAGDYSIEGRHVIVSRGLGTHTFHVRINNRAELLCLRVLPQNTNRGAI